MSVSIVVPFSSDGAERDRNWCFLKARYEALYPDWEIVEGTCEPPWRKGVAVNAAAQASSGDVLVISDADVMIGQQALIDAVGRLEDSAWVVPHRLVYRLNEAATKALIADELRINIGPVSQEEQVSGSPRKGPPGGGMLVTRREDFVGMDERFVEWGGEDISLGWALDTLVGPHRSLGQVMWHLHHEPMHGEERRGSPESEALASRYREASGDPVVMGQLLAERPYEGVEGGGMVVVSRETLTDIPLDSRFRGYGQEDEAFAAALKCLKGPAGRGEAELVHLWHEPQERISRARGSWESWELRSRYLQAQHDPDVMEGLVKEARDALQSA